MKKNISYISISKRLAIGLTIMLISLALPSILALYSFFSFNKTLNNLSGKSIPNIVQEALFINLASSLLHETTKLASADLKPERRIAIKEINKLFKQIKSLLTNTKFSSEISFSEIKELENTLNELNLIVKNKINTIENTDKHLLNIFTLIENIIKLEQELAYIDFDYQYTYKISLWFLKSIDILNYSFKCTSCTLLYKLKKMEDNISRDYESLKSLTSTFPINIQAHFIDLQKEIGKLILGHKGLIYLLGEQIKISNQSAGKGNFSKSMVKNFINTNLADFNKLVSKTDERAADLSQKVYNLTWLFIILLLLSFLSAIGVIIYFRHKISLRLLNLNKFIIDRMEGKNVIFKEKDEDEIADMSRSFIFYMNEVAQKEKELQQLASLDSLTGINNHRSFFEHAKAEISRSSRHKTNITFLMIDLDHFKSINDNYGHQVGDFILTQVASVCLKALREEDILGRLGGEEFGVLLPQTDLDMGICVAERLRQSISNFKYNINNLRINCTASIGVATSNGEEFNIENLIKRADDALYIAKSKGRNCVYPRI